MTTKPQQQEGKRTKNEQPGKPPDAARSPRHCQPITLVVQAYRSNPVIDPMLHEHEAALPTSDH
jgi:hypothetical protein